jgi:predicted nuclease of predicted toxin-antitoxin system
MKLLFDQNISFRITNKIQDIFPGSKQVRDLALENSKDSILWNYAKENGYCIVTFDGDFYDLGLVKGSWPKVIWLRLGNTSTLNIENVLRKNYDLIKIFLSDSDYKDIGCLEINSL